MHAKRFQVHDFQTLLCGIMYYQIINVILRFLQICSPAMFGSLMDR